MCRSTKKIAFLTAMFLGLLESSCATTQKQQGQQNEQNSQNGQNQNGNKNGGNNDFNNMKDNQAGSSQDNSWGQGNLGNAAPKNVGKVNQAVTGDQAIQSLADDLSKEGVSNLVEPQAEMVTAPSNPGAETEKPATDQAAQTLSAGAAAREERIYYAPEAQYAELDLPITAELRWVGYDFREREGVVRIEMITQGAPKFKVAYEVNRAGQMELLVRFFGTSLRKKVRRDIDASEFKSPVAFVRMRPDSERHWVDVLVTMRDKVQPKLFAKDGHVALTFAIPDSYFGNSSLGAGPVGRAVSLTATSLFPSMEKGTDLPDNVRARSYFVDPTEKLFQDIPADEEKLVVAKIEDVSPSGNQVLENIPANNFTDPAAQPVNPSATPKNAGLFNGEPTANALKQPQNSQPKNNMNNMNNANNEANQQNEQEEQQGEQQNQQQEQEEQQENGNDFDKTNGFDEEKFEVRGGTDGIIIVQRFVIGGVGQDNGFSVPKADASKEQKNSNVIAAPSPNGNPASNNFWSNEKLDKLDAGNKTNTISIKPGKGADKGLDGGAKKPETEYNVTSAGDMELVGQDTEVTEEEASLAKTVDLDFRGAPLSEVLRAIGEESGRNFVVSAGTVGSISIDLQLKDVPWTDALKAVLETNGLGMVEVSPNVIRIDYLDALISEKKKIFDARKAAAALTPKKILVMRLNHAMAGVVAGGQNKTGEKRNILPVLQSMMEQSDLQSAAKVVGDPRTNSLIIEAIPRDLAKIKLLVERLDRPTPQVKIVSRLAESLKTFQDTFGIGWSTPFNYDQGRGLGFGTLPFPNYINSYFTVDPNGSTTTPLVGRTDIRLGSINNMLDLDLHLRMEETKGNMHVLQTQTVFVEDNEQARINGGKRDYVRTVSTGANGISQVTLSPIDYDLLLEVTPQVTADGSVQMDLLIKSESPTPASLDGAIGAMSKKELHTLVLRKSGETLVIGGIYTNETRQQVRGVPFLMDLPIIGALFRQTIGQDDQKDLLVMITPTIMNSAELNGAARISGPAPMNGGQTIATLEKPANAPQAQPLPPGATNASKNFGGENPELFNGNPQKGPGGSQAAGNGNKTGNFGASNNNMDMNKLNNANNTGNQGNNQNNGNQ